MPGLKPMITWHCMLPEDGKIVRELVGDKSLIYIFNTVHLVCAINCVH